MEPSVNDSAPIDEHAAPRGRSSWIALGAFVFVAGTYIATLAYMPKDGFWIVDNGCKFIQMQSIIQSDYADFSIDWPGAKIDPEFKYSPLSLRFGHVIDGKLYGTFAPFFPMVSSFPYRAWGMVGLYAIPLFGGLLTLTAVWKLAAILADGRARLLPALAIVVAGLATPIWFYSVAFWEHTPGTGLACWAMVFFLLYMRDARVLWVALSGVACAASIYFRDDLYVLTAVLAVGLFVLDWRHWYRGVLFGVVAAIGLAPLWWFQWKVLGNPLGHHFTPTDSDAVAHGYLMDRWLVFRHLFVGVGTSWAWSLLFAIPLFWLWFRRMGAATVESLPEGKSSFAGLALFGAVGGAIVLYCQMSADSPPQWLLVSNSLFAAGPLVVMAFCRCDVTSRDVESAGFLADRMIRVSLRILMAYALVYALLTPEVHAKGVHWGCRYLLTIYPLLAVFAAYHILGWWKGASAGHAMGRFALVALIGVSIGGQLHALGLMRTMKDFRVRLNEAISQDSEEVIIATSWWIPMELSQTFGEKTIFLDRTGGERSDLKRRLFRAGYRRATILWSPPHNDAFEKEHRVLHDGLEMFAVEVEDERLP